jgi:hypothetical protein
MVLSFVAQSEGKLRLVEKGAATLGVFFAEAL